MKADVFWVIPQRLAILPKPRSGEWLEDEIASYSAQGLQVLLSLLTPDEEIELGLTEEARLAEQYGLNFLRYPIPDRGVPKSATHFAEVIIDLADSGKAVGVHCRSGIGRSGLACAAIMLCPGHALEQAWQVISTTRRVQVPDTAEQRRWLEQNVMLFQRV
ncbi:MAG: dual specificity protein phosphatase family protein [Planctomycetes bacterium]|nr:dual specificity protein phosphatase family protein [Planctomycetota bacterium]MCB9935209.1 dual specificity protein phosphatase family protein [Planctomycetota bacterium]